MLAMKTKQERQKYLAGVEEKRGKAGREILEKEILKQWNLK